MKQELKPNQVTLLKEIVRNRCPTLISRLQTTTLSELTRTERELIIDALGNEFAAAGITEDSEPNQRGFEIEDIIDIVNRPNLM